MHPLSLVMLLRYSTFEIYLIQKVEKVSAIIDNTKPYPSLLLLEYLKIWYKEYYSEILKKNYKRSDSNITKIQQKKFDKTQRQLSQEKWKTNDDDDGDDDDAVWLLKKWKKKWLSCCFYVSTFFSMNTQTYNLSSGPHIHKPGTWLFRTLWRKVIKALWLYWGKFVFLTEENEIMMPKTLIRTDITYTYLTS